MDVGSHLLFSSILRHWEKDTHYFVCSHRVPAEQVRTQFVGVPEVWNVEVEVSLLYVKMREGIRMVQICYLVFAVCVCR